MLSAAASSSVPVRRRQRVSTHSVRIILFFIGILIVSAALIALLVVSRRIRTNTRTENIAIVENSRGTFSKCIPGDRVSMLPAVLSKTVKRVKVSNSPVVDILNNFFSNEEADAVLAVAAGRFKPSTTMNNDSNTQSKDRTSWTVFLNAEQDNANPLLRKIKEKAALAAGIAAEYIEPLQVVKYEHGEFYRQHYDYLDASSNEVKEFGQRTLTILVYLNTLEEADGGGTRFHVLKHTVNPVKGSALLWHNVSENTPDPRTLHSGEPILTPGCTKYAMNIWFRDKIQK